MTPFDKALVVFGVAAGLGALINAYSVGDALRRQRAIQANPKSNAAMHRFAGQKVRKSLLLLGAQILMILAAMVAFLNPPHTGAWILTVISGVQVLLNAVPITDIYQRAQALADLAGVDGHHDALLRTEEETHG